MTNKTHGFSLGLLTIALTSGVISAIGQPAPARPPIPELKEGRQAPLCDSILAIKGTDTDGQGHLKVGQWLRFLGPIPNQGHMLVIPMNRSGPQAPPPHAWQPGTHVAFRTTPVQDPPPWKFFLTVPVLSPPDHPNVFDHHYVMTVKALDGGCPAPGSIDIDTLPEDDEIIDDHPGHANA